MAKSRITVDIDLEKQGKHIGFARLPHSVNRSAYGWLPIPIVSIRNGVGRRVLLLAGSHGDEYEGQVALTKLVQEFEANQIQGQLIIMPMTNYPAALAGTRTSPLDDGNLNRLYPGRADGTPSEMIAHFVETELMPRVDLVLDIHSGGASLNYLPCSTSVVQPDAEKCELDAVTLMRHFGAPYGLLLKGKSGIGSISEAATRNKIIRIGTEVGGRAWVERTYRELCEAGIKRVLAHLEIINSQGLPAPDEMLLIEALPGDYVYAHANGLFESAVRLGDQVEQGDLAGSIYFPATLNRPSEPVFFGSSGIVLCERPNAMCEVGDCLLHLARPVSTTLR
ncbi:putative deacylase [Comamonas sp. BIGb0152]|nr:putative deacylase [Comamonas sp. BIGb0152]